MVGVGAHVHTSMYVSAGSSNASVRLEDNVCLLLS